MIRLSRLLSLALVLMMVFALCACNSGGNSPAQGTTSADAPAKTASGGGTGASTPETVGGKVSILTWTNPSAVTWLKGMAARLLDARGITLDIADIDSANHPQTRQTRLMANDVDIVTYEGGFLRPLEDWNDGLMDKPAWQEFVESDLFLDITDEPFMDNFDKALMTDAYGYKGRIYGLMAGSIPLNGVFYNIDVYDELGLKVPETWDEFVSNCEAIRAAGMEPITCGGGAGWPLNMFANNMLTNNLLDEGPVVSKALFLGEKKFTDPDMMEFYRIRSQFASFMEPGVTGVPYSDCYGRFATRKAVMLADGSWAAGDVTAAGPDFEFSYFPLPGVEKRADGLPAQMGVKYDFAMVIVKASPNLEAAKQVLDFFSQKDEYVHFVNEVGFYPTQSDCQYDNDFLKSMASYMQKPRQVYPVYTPKGVGQDGGNGGCDLTLLDVLGGPYTYQQLAEAAQADWDNARAANAAAAK